MFASLVPGQYELTAELSGFSTKQTRTTVPVGATVAVNIGMARRPADRGRDRRRRDRAQRSTPRPRTSRRPSPRQQIRELPTITRNPYDLVQLSGQAAEDPESNRGTGYAINGARSASTNILLDGSANNDEFTATRRPGRAARLRPGVLGHHVELLGPVRPRLGRHRERGHQVRHEPVPRHRLRLLPQRRPRHQHVRQQGERDREGQVRPPPDGLQPRRPGRQGQGPLLHERRVHPRPLDRHADQLDPDAGVHRGERPGDPGSSSTPTAAARRSTARP